MRKVVCKECGEGFTSRQYNADFCGSSCRKDFNNRRLTRGAMLYDVTMLMASPVVTAASQAQLKDRLEGMMQTWYREDETAKRSRTTKRLSDVLADTLRYAVK